MAYDGKLKKGDRIILNGIGNNYGIIHSVNTDNTRATVEFVGSDWKSTGMYAGWNISRSNASSRIGQWGSDGASGSIDFVGQPVKTGVTLKTVIIPAEKTQQILTAISQQANAIKIFEEWGFSEIFEKGIAVTLLFWGIPGTGKTLTAQAIADELKMELKIYQTADIETSEPGGAERAIRQIFQDNKGHKTIILFDECDSLLMDRNEIGPILGAQVNALLTEIERYDGVIVFTTNRLGKLDPALERRITTKVEFPFPDSTARKAIWKRMIPKKCPLNADVDYDKLAEYPLTGGNIKNAVLNAARSAAYSEAKELCMKDFVQAIEKESQSIQSFAAEYEKQIHGHQISGHDFHRDMGKIRKVEKVKKKDQLTEAVEELHSDSKKELLEELKGKK